MITISYSKIKKYVFLLPSLPLIVFAIGWLKWTWALALILGVAFCYYMAVFRRETEEQIVFSVNIKKWVLITVIAIAAVWVWQSGIGGMWAQSKDYPWRNAIFRDLILHEWPVYYDTYGAALVYYIGYWLPAAVFGRLSYLLGASAEVAFQIGNLFLYLWSVLCIIAVFLLSVLVTKADTTKKQIVAVVLFVFFSGMDALGSIQPLGASLYHIEWWAGFAQYSSFSTCLFWVFNQSVLVWICMLCLLQERNTSNYVFLGMCCLFGGPLPFVGMFLYCLVLGIEKTVHLWKKDGIKQALGRLLSLSNVVSCIAIFPVIAAYLLSNNALNGGNLRIACNTIDMSQFLVDNGRQLGNMVAFGVVLDLTSILGLVKFWAFEFGIYALLIARKYWRTPVYWVTVGSLLVFPFLKIGHQTDFPMRASIPALMVLYVLCCKFLFEEAYVTKKNVKEENGYKPLLYKLLVICLIIGTWTAQVEFIRGVRQVIMHGIHWNVTDFIYTLGGDGIYQHGEENGSSFTNFICSNPEESSFFLYFAKDLR